MSLIGKKTKARTQNDKNLVEMLRMITAQLDAIEASQNTPDLVNMADVRRIHQQSISQVRRQVVRAPQVQQREDHYFDPLVDTREKVYIEESSWDELNPEVFLEVMNYTLISYVGDFINYEDGDILLYNKSLTITSKFKYGFSLLEKRHDVGETRLANELDDSFLLL
ncbi:hypothetical protein RND71_015986 [Anisodus tanguticus]|uniref:Uncharacterized protein n=1 Tax=Anisodus tanguticus TaxID=243964 RepID=A0AAE1VCB1_9SOLA|nr:hypothetical protein RND71_015986 [Anisodus tanguticus]